jgi:hypothetical protein
MRNARPLTLDYIRFGGKRRAAGPLASRRARVPFLCRVAVGEADRLRSFEWRERQGLCPLISQSRIVAPVWRSLCARWPAPRQRFGFPSPSHPRRKAGRMPQARGLQPKGLGYGRSSVDVSGGRSRDAGRLSARGSEREWLAARLRPAFGRPAWRARRFPAACADLRGKVEGYTVGFKDCIVERGRLHGSGFGTSSATRWPSSDITDGGLDLRLHSLE